MSLLLLGTDHCHLCEQAEQLLRELEAENGLQWKKVDISESDNLVEQYGLRIPVLKQESAPNDLGWPFDKAGIRDYLAQNGS